MFDGSSRQNERANCNIVEYNSASCKDLRIGATSPAAFHMGQVVTSVWRIHCKPFQVFNPVMLTLHRASHCFICPNVNGTVDEAVFAIEVNPIESPNFITLRLQAV